MLTPVHAPGDFGDSKRDLLLKDIYIDPHTQPVATVPCPDGTTLAGIEEAALEFVAEAGRLVLERYGGTLQVGYKDKKRADPVTEVDRAVEAYLTEAVSARFPSHAVLGEEGQEPQGRPEYEWIVDPVDGTHNFINGLPLFAVSIGVLYRRRPVVGALLFPVSDEVLHARCGGGAFRNGERIHCGAVRAPGPSLISGLSIGFPSQFKVRRPLAGELGDARSLGSIAYEMGMVATGALDYAVFRGPHVWDVAGGVTIVREAGGEVLRYSRSSKGWLPLERFASPPPRRAGQERTLRNWSAPILVGAVPVIDAVAAHLAPRYAPRTLTAARGRFREWKVGREEKHRNTRRSEQRSRGQARL